MNENINCKVCGRQCKNSKSLGAHIVKSHRVFPKNYYDEFLLVSPNLCEICQTPTGFINLTLGYRRTCSQKCAQKLACLPQYKYKAKQTCLIRYGVENPSLSKIIKRKISATQKRRFSNPLEREKTSLSTKIGMAHSEVRSRYEDGIKKRNNNKEWRKKLSDAIKELHKNPKFHNAIYTDDRNEKVSTAKKQFWKDNPEKKKRVGNLWKLQKEKDEAGWRRRLIEIGKIGFLKFSNGVGETKLEKKMYSFLDDNNIKYDKQYELDYKIYDAYLPDYNLLVEFDGEFWHKQTLDECKYQCQVYSFHNDQLKNEIAKKHNLPLLRVRESESPDKITNFIRSLDLPQKDI